MQDIAFNAAQTALARTPVPVTSGLSELDTLLGGGLTWGTTTLFIGPAGVGNRR